MWLGCGDRHARACAAAVVILAGSLTEIRNCGGTIDCEVGLTEIFVVPRPPLYVEVSPWASWDECDKSPGARERGRRHERILSVHLHSCSEDMVQLQPSPFFERV